MNAYKDIRGVTLDVGGTMLEPWPSVGHVYAQVAAESGFPGLNPEDLNAGFRMSWKLRRNFQHSRDQWAELVDASFSGLIPVQPSATFFPALYDRFAEPKAWRLYEDVLATLDTLASEGIQLAVVSNWDERLRPLLDRFKLASYFDVIVVSCEVAFPKPSPVIFEEAVRKMGLLPQQILHVGDHPREDVEGARGAGLAALHLQRGGRPGDGIINSLSDIPSLLSR
ncbi:MAG TPA: HAD-IA family hydrolase [Roseimicrobium sp.]|nr:HAD-IA family hydrolase [Roseimicrobium sp.]